MATWKHGDSTSDMVRKILQNLSGEGDISFASNLAELIAIFEAGPRQGGFSSIVTDNTAVNTSAYNANDVVGGLRTLALGRIDGAGLILQSVQVTDLSDQKADLNLIFFSANPSASTTTDHGALAIHANDIAKVLGIVNVAADDYLDLGSYSIATKTGIGLVLKPTTGTNIYCVAVTTGTPDYVNATDLSIAFGVLQD